MTAATLGHNGPPDDIEQGWVDFRHALMVAIRDDKSLSPRARILGVMVCTYMAVDGTGARPSVRTLADVTGFGVNTIAKIMALVEEAGWMRIKRGSRKVGTTYETAQSYEDAIATYVKGARGRYADTVTKQDEPLSPSESDKTKETVTARGDKHRVMSPSRSDKQGDKGGFVTDVPKVLSPDATVLSPNATFLSPPGSDRRTEDKKIDSLSTPLPPKDKFDLLDGEQHVGHGVIVNCETIRHVDNHFQISIPAVMCRTLGVLDEAEVKTKLQGFALQWGLEIEGGKAPDKVVPRNPLNWLVACLQGDETRKAVGKVKQVQARRDSGGPDRPKPRGNDAVSRALARLQADRDQKFSRELDLDATEIEHD